MVNLDGKEKWSLCANPNLGFRKCLVVQKPSFFNPSNWTVSPGQTCHLPHPAPGG